MVEQIFILLYNLSVLGVIFIIASIAVLVMDLFRVMRAERAEEITDSNRAERAAEEKQIGEKVKRDMLIERMSAEFAERQSPKKKPIRKMCGIFSDEAAQKLLK